MSEWAVILSLASIAIALAGALLSYAKFATKLNEMRRVSDREEGARTERDRHRDQAIDRVFVGMAEIRKDFDEHRMADGKTQMALAKMEGELANVQAQLARLEDKLDRALERS